MNTLKIGDMLPALSIPAIDRNIVEAYVAASNDDSILHLDDNYARALGLPGALVHGSYVAGLVERLLRNWREDIEVLCMKIQFVNPIFHGTALELTGRIAAIDPAGATVRIVARDSSNSICCIGAAECALSLQTTI